jgi:septum formation protein
MSSKKTILLASGSPRRRELLSQLDVFFTVEAADIDETMITGETPEDYVMRLAREKALAGLDSTADHIPSLGSDTIVLLDGNVLGKPASRAEAEAMLLDLSNSTHHVYSSVALALEPGSVMDALNITAVTFGKMPLDWIEQYCQSDEPMDKAGAYAIQGGAGQFIRRIKGSYTGVMGLPLYETAELLRRAGLLR